MASWKGELNMGWFRKQKEGGVMDVIRCDEPSYLIWKWHPKGTTQGKNKKENAIRWGSSLRVKDGEVAVFVYKQPDGVIQDYVEGPYDGFLESKNLPVLTSVIELAYGGDTPFPAEVYFINLAKIIQVRFGVPYFDVYDPRFLDFGVPVAVRGTITFQIKDYQEFIELHRLSTFDLEDFQKQIRDAVSRYVKGTVANIPSAYTIPVVQLETKTFQINKAIEQDLVSKVGERFGVEISGVDIGAIEIDKNSEGYRQLMTVTKNTSVARVHAETADYVERLRIRREEDQYAVHKQTQTANIGAFQVEKQAEVGVAGAEALGKMGKNGAGTINLGSSETGFNPASMMAGVSLGGAVGQNIAGTFNKMMESTIQQAPPPIPVTTFYVAVDGKPAGPYDISTLSSMVRAGKFTRESLVWKAGMANWEVAGIIKELDSIWTSSIPPIPQD